MTFHGFECQQRSDGQVLKNGGKLSSPYFTVLGVSEAYLRWPRLSYLELQADLFDDAFKEIVSRQRYEVRADPLLSETTGLPTYTGQGSARRFGH